MWGKLKVTILGGLLQSKKARMAIVGLIVAILLPILNGKFGLGLTEDQLTEALYPIIAFIIGQGMADWGKEKLPDVIEGSPATKTRAPRNRRTSGPGIDPNDTPPA